MKYLKITLLSFYLLFFITNSYNISKIREKLGMKDEMISDSEIEEILKDPKYASIANSMGDDKPGDTAKSAKPDHKSPSPKLVDLPQSSSPPSRKSDLDVPSLDSGIYNTNLASSPPSRRMSHPPPVDLMDDIGEDGEPRAPKEDKFKSFDFISKQQARYILEILKQPSIYTMLPLQAKQIIDVLYFI